MIRSMTQSGTTSVAKRFGTCHKESAALAWVNTTPLIATDDSCGARSAVMLFNVGGFWVARVSDGASIAAMPRLRRPSPYVQFLLPEMVQHGGVRRSQRR